MQVTKQQLDTLHTETLAQLDQQNKGCNPADMVTLFTLVPVDWLDHAEFANFIYGVHGSLIANYGPAEYASQYWVDGLPPNFVLAIEAQCKPEGNGPPYTWYLALPTHLANQLGDNLCYEAYLVSDHYNDHGTANIVKVVPLA